MPSSLDDLIQALRALPGVGPKSAARMAYHLLQRDRGGAARLARTLDLALDKLTHCTRCNSFSETPICPICSSGKRDERLLAVVEMPADLMAMEASGGYRGLYFVLMGRLSPLDGVGPRDIHLDRLLERARDGVEEVILATNFTAEGEATAHAVGQLLAARGLRVTRIARGLPVGGELEHVDMGTLAQALRDRREV